MQNTFILTVFADFRKMGRYSVRKINTDTAVVRT
jgi:hypothetical protein